MAARGVLSDMHTIAREVIDSELQSLVYPRIPIATLLMHKAGGVGRIGSNGGSGRPASGAIYGGTAMNRKARLKSLAGSTQRQVLWQKNDVSASKWLGRGGTTPSQGGDYQTDSLASAYFGWSKFATTIQIPRADADAAMGKSKLIDITSTGTNMSMEQHLQGLAQACYTGTPTSESADIIDSLIGLDVAIDDGNSYGGVNRATSSNSEWRGKEVSDATVASLDMVDDANLTHEISKFGDGIDVMLCGNTIYRALKAQANAEQQLITTATAPEEAVIGFLKESFKYNGVTYVLDFNVAASTVYGLTMKTWCFEVHPSHNFRVTPFRDGMDDGQFGEADVITAKIVTQSRLYCEAPKLNIKWTNVSAS